jgi:Fe-S-cluster-containing hydrogenase component 2
VIDLYYPLHSLQEGHWFKLICGASFQHLPAIRNLTLAFTLAGADCIDVAADPAIIAAAAEAIEVAIGLAEFSGSTYVGQKPWLMVSLNDGEDPHFRKASFDPSTCPADCDRPCERICPTRAIVFSEQLSGSGVIADRCYGCGRCIPICPVQHITTHAYVSTPVLVAPLVLQTGVDAIEIHTQIGRLTDFHRLWQVISPHLGQLKLIAISCPDGNGLVDYLWALADLMTPLPCPLIWQTDGRPMSGDIGMGATRAAVRLGQKVLKAGLPGYVQLAGGTNHHTVEKLQALSLLHTRPLNSTQRMTPKIAGIAYGSYARSLLSPILAQLEALQPSDQMPSLRLEDDPALLKQAVNLATALVSQLKPLSLPNNFSMLSSCP